MKEETDQSIKLAAKMIIKEHEEDWLESVAKLHFNPTQASLAK